MFAKNLSRISSDKSLLLCFSPAVMLGTFLIEYLLAVYVLVRYRQLPIGRVAALILMMLGTFQLAEYQICVTGADNWALTGLAAITLLPPLGIHLISQFTKRLLPVIAAYAVAGAFLWAFATVPDVLQGATCGGNYVILHLMDWYGYAYGAYYFGYLLVGLWQTAQLLRQPKLAAQDHVSILWIMIGYLAFMVPMGIIYQISAEARDAVPSIMCGFAVLWAFILAYKVLPPQLEKQT